MKPLETRIRLFGLHPTRRSFIIFSALLLVLSSGTYRVFASEADSPQNLPRFIFGCSIASLGLTLAYGTYQIPQIIYKSNSSKHSEFALEKLRNIQMAPLYSAGIYVLPAALFGTGSNSRPYLLILAQLVLIAFVLLVFAFVKLDPKPPLGPHQLEISEENQLLFSLTRRRTEFIATVNQLIRQNKPYTAMQKLMSDNQKTWDDNVQLLYLIARHTP